MTDRDIVERLREDAAVTASSASAWLEREAAEEIERLEHERDVWREKCKMLAREGSRLRTAIAKAKALDPYSGAGARDSGLAESDAASEVARAYRDAVHDALDAAAPDDEPAPQPTGGSMEIKNHGITVRVGNDGVWVEIASKSGKHFLFQPAQEWPAKNGGVGADAVRDWCLELQALRNAAPEATNTESTPASHRGTTDLMRDFESAIEAWVERQSLVMPADRANARGLDFLSIVRDVLARHATIAAPASPPAERRRIPPREIPEDPDDTVAREHLERLEAVAVASRAFSRSASSVVLEGLKKDEVIVSDTALCALESALDAAGMGMTDEEADATS